MPIGKKKLILKMMENKLTLEFNNLNQVIDFYKSEIKKSSRRAAATVVSIGVKGFIVPTNNGGLAVTWNFKTESKRNKFIKAYSNFKSLQTI